MPVVPVFQSPQLKAARKCVAMHLLSDALETRSFRLSEQGTTFTSVWQPLVIFCIIMADDL